MLDEIKKTVDNALDPLSATDDGEWKDTQAEIIKLEVEQKFQGVLVDKRRCNNKEKSMLYAFDTGERVVKLFGTAVLDDRLALVQIGSEVRIVYKGKKQLDGNKTFHDFDVKFRKPKA